MSRAPATPIMSKEQERFMAFEGLVQWTKAVAVQAKRIPDAVATRDKSLRDPEQRHIALLQVHSEAHYFANRSAQAP